MNKLITSVCLCLCALGASAQDVAALRAAVAEDLTHEVRPGGVNGQPFWNQNAVWFLYPPAFDFPEVKGATQYRFRVFDAKGKLHDFDAKSPKSSLAPVWKDLPTGKTDVWCEGHNGWTGHILGRSFRSFYKMAPFEPGAYPKAPRGYAEAAKLGYGYLLNMPALRKFVETGKPDPDYVLNCYPSKMHSAVIRAMLTCAKSDPAHRDAALKLARTAGDYLLSIAQPAGAPLAGFTPTYEGKNLTAAEYAGQTMLDYPCRAGSAFVALYTATGEAKYLAAAERIAETYLRLQGADGTWYLKLYEKDAKSVNPNRLHPLAVIDFMDDLFAVTKKAEYHRCADRAFAFIEKGPLTDWNWEGQYEDVRPTEKYVNLTKHPACTTAIRIVSRWPKDAKRLAQARDLLRFAEDQFVCWRRPFTEMQANLLNGKWAEWAVEPGVVEQYHYREIIDASLAKLIATYLALYRATGNALDLAKARALGDALVRVQDPSGRIPTVMTVPGLARKEYDWLNCMVMDFEALSALAEQDRAADPVPAKGNAANPDVVELLPVPRPVKMTADMDRPVAFGPKTTVSVACPDAEGVAWLKRHFAEWYGALAPQVAAGGGRGATALPKGDEAYAIEADADGVRISARTLAGVRWASYTLRQLAVAKRGTMTVEGRILPTLAISDAPHLAFRGIHICWIPEFRTTQIERAIRLAALMKFNYCVLEPWGMYRSEKHPWWGWPNGKMTKAEVSRLVALGKDLGITLIPQINAFGHGTLARSCTLKNAILDLNPKYEPLFEPGGWNWCLTNPETQRVLRELIAEMHENFGNPPYFHLGCDEADPPSCPECRKTPYGELVCKHISGLVDYLKGRGARAMMWHDMLIRKGDPRWKDFVAYGTASTAKLADTLPKDVVICDWEYSYCDFNETRKDWPTLAYFKEKGFPVVGCPWLNLKSMRPMADYISENGGFGYLQTTWHHLRSHDWRDMYRYGSAAAWGTEPDKQPGLYDLHIGLALRLVGHDMKIKDYTDTGDVNYQVPPSWWIEN